MKNIIKKNKTRRNRQKRYKNTGQALITATIFLLLISATVVFGLAGPTVRQIKIGAEVEKSRRSYFLAEAGIEDSIYRLKNVMDIDSSENISLDGYSAVTDITDDADGKTIISVGNFADHFRKVQLKISEDVGVSFNYGIQVGQGGLTMDNNAGIDGNVYSNGDIVGSNGTFVTGSAVAANSVSVSTDEVNDFPIPPPDSINFKNTSLTRDFAQSFQAGTSSPVNKVQFYIKKIGNPGNISNVYITTNSSGNPGTILASTGSINSSLVTSNYGWIDALFTTNIELNPGTTYWLVITSGNQSSANYYNIGANSAYSSGQAKLGQYGGTWNNTSPLGLDGYFRIYVGGITSTISDITVGSGGVGNAYAHEVNGSTIAGSLYCQEGSGNNKPCDTSLPDPSPIGFPVSDANVEEWKSDADSGGTITGNYTPVGASSSLGPKKIAGNLILPSDHDLTITGTVWVTGNVIMPNTNIVRLHSGYGSNSGIMVVDGYVRLENGTQFYGSGQNGTYLLLLTTSGSDCSAGGTCAGYDAIEIGNNTGLTSDRVIANAQNGRVDFGNNSKVKAVNAKKVHLNNNVIIEYESGVANTIFTSGPGGTWDIRSWREIE